MIVQLTGTLLEVTPSRVVMDVGGVGYELGVSSTTAASLPHVGEAGVTVLARMIVREDAMELYGFATREERALFDQLRAISGVGPKLALSVLSTFSPGALAQVVMGQDAARMAQVPGVGRKKASRLLVELSDVFSKNAELRGLVGLSEPDAALPRCRVRGRRGPALYGLHLPGGRARARGTRGGRCRHHRAGARLRAAPPGEW